MFRILTFITEIQLWISVTRLFKSFMGLLIMLYEKDIWDCIYIFPVFEIFYIIPILIYVVLK